MKYDSHTISLLKAVTHRLSATAITFSLVYLFTGDLGASSSIAVLEVVVKLLWYYLHERIYLLFAVETTGESTEKPHPENAAYSGSTNPSSGPDSRNSTDAETPVSTNGNLN